MRSLLFAPGNEECRLRGALESDADAVIADLEDAVPAAEKERAHAVVRDVLGERDAARPPPPPPNRRARRRPPGRRPRRRRRRHPQGHRRRRPRPTTRAAAVALVETPAGLREAHDVASSPAVTALMLGAADLSAALGLEPFGDRLELLFAREGRGAGALAGTMIDEPVAARARGILARTRRDGG